MVREKVENLIRTLNATEQRVAMARVYARSYLQAASLHQDGAWNDLLEKTGLLNEECLKYNKAYEAMTAPVTEESEP